MKKNILIFTGCLIFISLLCACSQAASLPSASLSPAATPEPAAISASPSPSFTEVTSNLTNDMESEKVVLGNYTYYLDSSKILTDGKETGFMLCRRDNTSGTEEPLNILSYNIAVFGRHLYFLTWSGNNEDFLIQDDAVNSLYRLDDGGGRTFISSGSYGNVISDALCIIGNTMYFTKYNESAVFKADLNCENIERIPIVLPEESDPLEYCKKMSHSELFTSIDLSPDEAGLISLTYHILNKSNVTYFGGQYTMSMDNHNVAKVSSGYYNNIIKSAGWIYYLDLDNPIESDEDDDSIFNIHRVTQDGSGDENLNITCFQFEIIDKYIYADSDLTFGDFAHWNTYRYNMDGTGKKLLRYSDMTRYFEGGRIYFTIFYGRTIYSADSSYGNVKKIKVKIPDDKVLKKRIGDNYELGFITVTDRGGNWLYFEFKVTDTGPVTYYTGNYRINLKTGKVEKTDKGTFYNPDTDGE